MPKNVSLPKQQYFPIAIPTNQSFTQQWHKWVYKKVSRHFKRNKERVPDTVQIVFLRLLSKDMIGRWFLKHLTAELVDRTEAERMLGGISLTFISQVSPTFGKRSDPESLWMVKDLLNYAKFDYERYYYSVQGHTLDSSKILKLLGYDPGNISALESLYRQGRLKPSELTEHECSENKNNITPHKGVCIHNECGGEKMISLGYCNKHSSFRTCSYLNCDKKHMSRGYCNVHYAKSKLDACVGCEHGRKVLASRGLSLTNRWDSPGSKNAAMKLRWNDYQLKGFLRDWRRQNIIKDTPRYIMRLPRSNGDALGVPGIDAGLLRYAEMIIDNAVVNDFKTLTRSDDISNMALNKGVSPEMSNNETVAWEGDKESETPERVICDTTSQFGFREFEYKHDAKKLASQSNLTPEEFRIVSKVDMSEATIREYATDVGKSIQQIHKIRNSALGKMKATDPTISDDDITDLLNKVSHKYDISITDIFSSTVVGLPVLARTDILSELHSRGMPLATISSRFSVSQDRVLAAINRASIRQSNQIV